MIKEAIDLFYNKAHKISLASVADNLKKKYPDLSNKIDFLAKEDPTPQKKYLPYAIKVLHSGQALENEIADVLKLFHQFSHKLDKKDINQWNFTDLRDTLFNIRDFGANKSKNEIKKELKEEMKDFSISGGETLYEDDQYRLIFVPNKATACKQGEGTRWCITMSNEKYYEDYTGNNVVFYYILRKDLPADDVRQKVAFAVHRDENNEIDDSKYREGIQAFLSDDTKVSPDAGTDYFGWLLTLMKQDAPKRPMGFLAKMRFKPQELSFEDYMKNMKEYEEEIAKNTKDPKILTYLSRSSNLKVMKSVSVNSATPKEALEKMVSSMFDNNDKLLEKYMINKYEPLSDVDSILYYALDSLSPALFEKIIPYTDSFDFDYGIAKNPAINSKIFDYLDKKYDYEDKQNAQIINQMAKNPSIPYELIKKYLDSQNIAIRMGVAQNPRLEEYPDLIEQIGKDQDYRVRLAILRNKNLKTETLVNFINNEKRIFNDKRIVGTWNDME
jgi:hypothetical protein